MNEIRLGYCVKDKNRFLMCDAEFEKNINLAEIGLPVEGSELIPDGHYIHFDITDKRVGDSHGGGKIFGICTPAFYTKKNDQAAKKWDEYYPGWRTGVVLFVNLDNPMKPMTFDELKIRYKDSPDYKGEDLSEEDLVDLYDKLPDLTQISIPYYKVDNES